MDVIQTHIPGVIEFQPKVFGDNRGYFVETFRKDIFEDKVGKVNFVQDNESLSVYGTLRGLHFQSPPFAQSKLVRVIRGKVLDVAVDIRIGSPTYGQHVSKILDCEKKNQLWIPIGFAHGFVVLSQEALFAYKVDNFYAPQYDGGIKYNDLDLGIDWMIPEAEIVVSVKDSTLPTLKTIDVFH